MKTKMQGDRDTMRSNHDRRVFDHNYSRSKLHSRPYSEFAKEVVALARGAAGKTRGRSGGGTDSGGSSN